MPNTTSTNFGSTLAIEYSKKQSTIKDFLTLENFTILFSIIAPLLSLVFIVLIVPIFKEYNSLANLAELHQFTYKNMGIISNLMYLLFFSYLFATCGLILGFVHKRKILIVSDFLSFVFAFGMFIPTWIMMIGD
ncbi:MAG: hypothetical protein GY936_20430 [Ignavibacteriae bacterium]|nr:hypothetical protein [Ignavibacteriota bacterium]